MVVDDVATTCRNDISILLYLSLNGITYIGVFDILSFFSNNIVRGNRSFDTFLIRHLFYRRFIPSKLAYNKFTVKFQLAIKTSKENIIASMINHILPL